MQDLMLPDYKGGSIVNLMSSLMKALGSDSPYAPLNILPSEELKDFDTVILLVIDGLGYDFLTTHGTGGILCENLKGSMTSVFPATTATAVTTFTTGVAPQQHAITGWFVYLKEIGTVTTILPFRSRSGSISIDKMVPPTRIFDSEPFFNKITCDSYYIIDGGLVDSCYTTALAGRAQRVPYYTIDDFFEQLRKCIEKPNSKYIYAYWSRLDAISHEYGTTSERVFSHFRELHDNLDAFSDSLDGTNTILLITADHGLVDIPREGVIHVKEHPEFVQTLSLPVCGEPRTAYCYVHPARTVDFENYVQEHFGNFCTLYKTEELVKKNAFGLFEPHQALSDRTGDYVLVMDRSHVLRHFIAGEREYNFVGYHAGATRDEMLVPLIVIK